LRAKQLGVLSRHLSVEYARSWMGKEVEVILESRGPRGGGIPAGAVVQGVSGNYLKIAVAGFPSGTDPKGKVVRALITAWGARCAADFVGFAE
jgi:tRNA A37 methylthiotransferase MiaB